MSLRKGSDGTVTSVSERKLRNFHVTLRIELCRFVIGSVTPGSAHDQGAAPGSSPRVTLVTLFFPDRRTATARTTFRKEIGGQHTIPSRGALAPWKWAYFSFRFRSGLRPRFVDDKELGLLQTLPRMLVSSSKAPGYVTWLFFDF